MAFRRSLALAWAWLLIASGAAHAGNYYVDAQNGSNSNSGTSPGDAWRTITHALASIPTAGADTIHVLPGLYDTALGELFPLMLRGGLTLRGTHERDDVTIAPPLTKNAIGVNKPGAVAVESLTVRALTPNKGATGISVFIFMVQPASTVTLKHLIIEHFDRGISARNGFGFTPVTTVRIEDVLVADCDIGIRLENSDDGFGLHCTIERSTIRDCEWGIFAYSFEGFTLSVLVKQTRILASSTAGIHLQNQVLIAIIQLNLVGSLIAGGAATGVDSYGSKVFLDGSTIAHNVGVGVRQETTTCCGGKIENSILWGNNLDLFSLTPYTVQNSNVGTGHPPGTNGNISVDPLFVDPSSGDFRLGFTSACVDALPPDPSALDLAGIPRDDDGDLNVAKGRDLGALELRNLAAPEVAHLGQSLDVELFGPAGASSLLLISRTGLLPYPLTTYFGERWLPLQGTLQFGPVVLQAPGPQQVTLHVPDVPALLGLTLGLQALSYNSAAPFGAAWGDPVAVTVVP